MIGLDQARMFCGLAAKQRTAGTHAPIGDTGDDRAESLRHDPTDGDVIQQEQRLGAANHQVITTIATRSRPTVSCLSIA